MLNIEKIDKELSIAKYGLPRIGDANVIWTQIKSNSEVLRQAVKIRRNKSNSGYIVNGLAISEAILIDYRDVDQVAYNELIKSIYTNKDIARLVIDGAHNGGYSFLLMSLWNHNIKLTEEQKAFAVDEAMNKIGTIRYKKQKDEYSKRLEEQEITDDIITTIDIDRSVNPIGAKTKNEYNNYIFTMLSDTQVHGWGPFDIRYQILRNPNWTLEEKQKLIIDFWYDDETYDEYLEQWEWGIVNDNENFKGNPLPPFDKYELLNEWTYKMLFEFYGNKETTDRIWSEIEFCKQMHKLRPQQWEIKISPQKVLTQHIEQSKC